MRSLFGSFRALLGRFFDDALPLNPDEREERDWTGETSDEEAERRQLAFKLKLL